jgi:pimeloyl-ACP methyl ester carboxylesterase
MLAEPPATAFLWQGVARALERQRRCLMPDLVGCGASERPASRRAYAIDAQSDALRSVLDALKVERVAVVASGLAAAIALDLAARAPDRVAALVLIGAVVHADSWPVAGVLPLLPRGAGETVLAALRRRPAAARRGLAAVLGTSDGAYLQPFVEPLRTAVGAAGLLRVLRAADVEGLRGARELVAAAPAPTLVLWGDADRVVSPEYGRRVAGEFGAAWVAVAGAGHLLAREQPERVAAEVAGFLADLA